MGWTKINNSTWANESGETWTKTNKHTWSSSGGTNVTKHGNTWLGSEGSSFAPWMDEDDDE